MNINDDICIMHYGSCFNNETNITINIYFNSLQIFDSY